MKTTPPAAKDPVTEEINALKAKLAEAEARRAIELGGLPDKYQFASLEDFFAAVKANYKPAKGKPGRRAKAATTVVKAPKSAKAKKRSRVDITPEIEAKTVELVKAGKTAAEVAKDTGVSEASVNVIKKKHGLTKPRKTSAPAA